MSSFPIHTDTPLHTRPWMNRLLIALNVAVLVAEIVDPGVILRFQLAASGLSLARFLTYAFIHLGWGHLLFNMLVLYLMGNSVNDRLGHGGYLAFYLGGAVFSGIGFILAGGDAVVGASGAVGAVMGAYLVLFPRSSIIIHAGFAVLEVPGMYFVIVYFLYNVLMSFTTPVGVQQVAYEAHIAGMIFGFVVSLGLLVSGLLPRQTFDFPSLLARWNRRRLYQRLVADGYDPFAAPPALRQPVAGPPPPDAADLRASALREQAMMAARQGDLPMAALLYRELKAIEPRAVLPRSQQLDVANQLAAEGHYADAAAAYEQLLEHYPDLDHAGEMRLMLGLIYGRHLSRYARARECIREAMPRLRNERAPATARDELSRIEPLVG